MPQDAEASLRAELSAGVKAAQAQIEKQLAQLQDAASRGAEGTPLAQANAQLLGLSRLQQRIAHSDAIGLSAMRGEVAAFIAASQALAQQAKSAETSLVEPAQAALYAASMASRSSVTGFIHDYYDQRIFDRYLRFSSTEDEAEYRRREEERKHDIEKAMAEHTPQGDLRANELATDQLKDAGEHGADRSPQYQPMLDGLEKGRQKLEGQLAAAAKSSGQTASPTNAAPAPQQDAPLPPEVVARLRQAQVTVADQTQDGHGVTARSVVSSNTRSV